MLTYKVRGPKDAASVSVDSDSTFQALKDKIASSQLTGMPPAFDLLMGFPPRIIQLEDDAIIDGHIPNNESLRVQSKELTGQQAQGASPPPSNHKQKKATAAATAATTATAATAKKSSTIATLGGSSSSKASTSKASSSSMPAGFGARIATLNTSSSAKKTGPSASRFGSLSTSASSSSTRKKATKRVAVSNTASSEGDISEHLLAAVSGGGSSRDRLLRKVFRNAVEHQYNAAKSLSRLSAVYSGQYSITENANARVLQAGTALKIDVKFQKGNGSRTHFEETVDLLPDEVLLELLKLALQDTEGAGREVLKPMNLSKCSPRIFWSLVYKHGQNLIQTIKTLLQEIDDCAWLTERKKELSEKAKENLRQQQEKEEVARLRRAKKRKASEQEGDSEVIDLQDEEEQKHQDTEVDVQKVTLHPMELEALQSVLFNDLLPEEWIDEVTTVLSSSKALDLANLKDVENFTMKLNSISNEKEVSVDQVEFWIQSAQILVLQAFWCRICGGGCERLRQALYALRIRVPKAILTWKSAAEGLHKGLLSSDPVLKELKMKFPSEVSTDGVFTVDAMKWMIQCCSELLESYSWIVNHDNIVEDEEEDEQIEIGEGEGEEEWKKDKDAHEYMLKRCRINVRGVTDNSEESLSNNLFYWEDGQVVAYLPPTEDEPMALWRVQIDEPAKKGKENKPRMEDLEEDEIKAAISLFHS